MTESQEVNGSSNNPQAMNSIAVECSDLKKAYDDCFNAWFTEKFLHGDRNLSTCDILLQKYTSCVKNAMKSKSIDMAELNKEYLGTPYEKMKP